MISSKNLKGTVFNIQKFSITDGHGIRTLIFMKGCPLHCLWCSNPESQRSGQEILYVPKHCIGCGKCYEACRFDATDPRNFSIDRERCARCADCVPICPSEAKNVVGRVYTVAEIMDEIEDDRVFYRRSGGGVTIGGGEPTAQPNFVTEVFKECKRLNIHTAIETCGYGDWEPKEKILKYVDQVFYDLKAMDDEVHRQGTGVSNRTILKNAAKVAAMSSDITYRLPLIPGYNDDEKNIMATGEFVRSLMSSDNDVKIEILPYHNMGSGKYDALGIPYELKDLEVPDKEVKSFWHEKLRSIGCSTVDL